jgi:hypothetical protein
MAVRVDTRPDRLTRAQWARLENVGLEPTLDLEGLVLDRNNPDNYGAMTGVDLESTIEGAPTVTITIRDPEMTVLEDLARPIKRKIKGTHGVDLVAVDEGWEPITAPSPVGRPVDVSIDGVVFRLTGVSYSTASGDATLTFEHRLVYWLRHKRGARRASRKTSTRAQFVLALVREIKARRYRFVCPELNVRQPIAQSSSRGLRDALGLTSTPDSGGVDTSTDHSASGFAPGAHITVKGRAATPTQRRILETALRRCDQEGATAKPRKALVLGMIEESSCQNLYGGDRDSSGVLQVRAATARGIPGLNPRDVDGVCRTFLRDGYWKYRPKGAIELSKDHPDWTAAQVTQACQGSAPNRYAQWNHDADGILEAWSGTGSESSAARGTYVKSYQFARHADEDSWTAIKRLADEIGWRCFVVGNSIYYMSERDLYDRRPRYELAPNDPSVLDLSYDIDWGKPVSECTLQVVLARWGAPPGSVVVISGYGPPDGRWLVTGTRRDYFSPVAEVTLKQPGPSKREPAPETGTRAISTDTPTATTKGSQSHSARLYAESKNISDAGGPYVYGGGHGPRLSTLKSGQGLDCSSSTSLALSRAGLFPDSVAWVSGKFASSYGQPGRGQHFTVWANGGHVWIEFHGLGAFKRFDTNGLGDGGRGPRMRRKQIEDTSRYVARHWPGC